MAQQLAVDLLVEGVDVFIAGDDGTRRDGIDRIRYTSPHPRHLTADLIDAHAEVPVLARHVHLPGEPFIEYQLKAQQARKDAFVCVAGYGDGGMGYIPTRAAYAEGGYEAGYRSARYEPDTGHRWAAAAANAAFCKSTLRAVPIRACGEIRKPAASKPTARAPRTETWSAKFGTATLKLWTQSCPSTRLALPAP